MASIVKKAQASGLLQSYWYTIAGLPLHVVANTNEVSTSNSLPVVLVHGLGVSSRYMLPTAVRLAPYFRVYAPDLPGFGKSPTPHPVLNISQLADALVKFLGQVGLKQVNFLANSVGCQVVLDLAMRYPTLIRRAILTGPTMDPHHRSSAVEIFRLLRDVPGESFNQVHLAIADYVQCGPVVMWQTFQYAMRDHIEAKLSSVGVPILVVRGSRDTIAPQRWVEEIVNLLPHGQLAVIPNAPHAVNNKAAQPLVELALPFLTA